MRSKRWKWVQRDKWQKQIFSVACVKVEPLGVGRQPSSACKANIRQKLAPVKPSNWPQMSRCSSAQITASRNANELQEARWWVWMNDEQTQDEMRWAGGRVRGAAGAYLCYDRCYFLSRWSALTAKARHSLSGGKQKSLWQVLSRLFAVETASGCLSESRGSYAAYQMH